MKVEDIGNALPSASRRVYRQKKNAPDQPMPKSLPECFAEVWRRRKSSLPVHRRERATLEAVAATIPPEAAGLTGQAAAAVYLGALIVSLDRLVQTTKPIQQEDEKDPGIYPQNSSKKKRKEIRRQELKAEEEVKDMTTTDVLRPMMKSTAGETMNVDEGDDHENNKDDANSDADLIASLMYLISSAMGGSSTAVLQAKGVQILDVVVRAMTHVPDHCLTARHASTCICQMLSIVDGSLWSKPVVQRSYLYLIRLTMDRDAKTRKKAREALHELLSGPRFPLIKSKTSGTASAHFVTELATHTASMKAANDSSRVSLPTSLVHTLTSIEQFATFLQPHHAAKVAKEILLIAAKQSQDIASFALLALWSILKHQVEDEQDAPDSQPCKSFLPSKDIAKLMTALLRLEIDEDRSQEWRIAYCSCAADGAMAYADYFTHTPPHLDFVSKPVAKVCKSLKMGNLERHAASRLTGCLQRLVSHRWFAKRPIVMKALRELLDDRFDSIRPNVMRVVKSYLEQEMSAGNPQMEECIVDFTKFCVSKREEEAEGETMAMSLLASMIRGGGAARVLSVVNVEYEPKEHVSNAWVLPLLLNNLRGAPLSLFFGQFVPLANKLKQAQQTCESQKRVIEAKNIGHYHAQTIGLLPGFCTSPSDLIQEGLLSETFKYIYSCMTTEKDKEMITNGADALRRLSASIMEKSETDLSFKQVSSSFSSRFKKLFPTICDVAENIQDESREAILRAVVTSCQATRNPTFVSSLLKKTIRRMLELQLSSANGDKEDGAMTDKDFSAINRAQHAAADLAISIIESKTLPTDAAELVFLEKAVSPFLSDPRESALQKKAYRSATLLVATREVSKGSSELLDFVKRVADQAKTVAPGAKASRLGLVEALIQRHYKLETVEEKTKYLQSINDKFLPEILLGTRDSSEKTRAASFTTLIALSRSWSICVPGTNYEGLQQFFMAVAAGLAGKTVSLLAATLTSFGRLMYDFRGEIAMTEDLSALVDSLFATEINVEDDTTMSVEDQDGAEKVHTVIEPGPIAILLRHNVVEVQKAALGVIKVATKSLRLPVTKTRLSDILPGIIPGLVHVAARSKKQETRLRVRVILERLLRKCGREALESNFPPEHAKLLAAVRKKYSRELVKKHAEKENRGARTQSSKAASTPSQNIDEMPEGESELDDSDSDIEKDILDGDTLLTENMFEYKPGNDKSGKGSSSRLSNPKIRNEYGIKFTDDGKPIFVESDAESGDVEVGSMYNDDSDDDEGPGNEKVPTGIRKRKRSDKDDMGDSGKRMKGSFGEEYRGKRGKGDVKRPGRPDPYAYVPLGQSMLGRGVRIGKSASKGVKQGSSLRRLADGVSAKRRVRKLGVPGRR